MMNCKYIKNRGFVPKIKIKMYSNGENTIMTMRYSLYFEAELIIIIANILLIISSLLILMITPNNRYWGLYIIIFVIFCDFGFYKTFKDETEKQRIVKTRVGQELFKKKLLAKSCKCAICGMNIKQLLRASHCKPWGKADNIERLDVNNGLLLCPTHDALFDNGMISFENDGSIIISNSIDKSQYQLLNIDKNIKLNFTKEQLNYIKYHREEEFK